MGPKSNQPKVGFCLSNLLLLRVGCNVDIVIEFTSL